MADTKKRNSKTETEELTVPAELAPNDNLEEYIQPSSLELLKARYAAIEEDEEIRNEGFELAKKSGLIKKQRPENPIYGYYSSPVNPKDEIRTDVDSPLSKVFDTTRSEFDATAVSFSDISFEQEKKDAEIKAEEVAVEVEKPKRKRTTKAAAETEATEDTPVKKRTTKTAAEKEEVAEKPKRTRTTKKKEEVVPEPVPEVVEETPAEPETPAPTSFNRYGFDTHTRVIYVDESADDGIKRNSEEELSSLFTVDDNKKKRRLIPWSRKKK